MGAVDHQGVAASTRLSQVSEDLGEHPKAPPAHEAVVQRLVRPRDGRSVLPAQAVAQDEQNPARPLRQATGLVAGFLKLAKLDLPVADFCTP